MGKKEEYKLKNEQFLQNLRTEEGVKELAAGVLYRILESGQGSSATPRPNSIVSVHYKGTLINGREFDNSWKRNCPEAFPAERSNRRLADSLAADARGRPLDGLHPVHRGIRHTHQRAYSGFLHTDIRSEVVGHCLREGVNNHVTERRPYPGWHNGYVVAFHPAYDGGFIAATVL